MVSKYKQKFFFEKIANKYHKKKLKQTFFLDSL